MYMLLDQFFEPNPMEVFQISSDNPDGAGGRIQQGHEGPHHVEGGVGNLMLYTFIYIFF